MQEGSRKIKGLLTNDHECLDGKRCSKAAPFKVCKRAARGDMRSLLQKIRHRRHLTVGDVV